MILKIKKYLCGLLFFLIMIRIVSAQKPVNNILFHGIVMDAETRIPIAGSQIIINSTFSSISDNEGKFAFYVSRFDTVRFRMLGYKTAVLHISDTLKGNEFITGIYMKTDTLSIDEIVIVPRLRTLKFDLLLPASEPDPINENARYNLELSAHQAKITGNRLGDPDINYQFLQQKRRAEVYSKGQIPSDQIVGLSPFMIIPAMYLLINGFPPKPPAITPSLSDYELNMIYKKYLETYVKN